MNGFIDITNRVIAEKLRDKIKISMIEYSAVEDSFVVKVKFCTDDFEPRVFSYTFYKVGYDDEFALEHRFTCFIENNFKVNEEEE